MRYVEAFFPKRQSDVFARADRGRAEHDLLDVAARHGTLAGWSTVFIAAFVHLVFGGRANGAMGAWWAAMSAAGLLGVAVCFAWRHRIGRLRIMGGADGGHSVESFRKAHAAAAAAQGCAWAALPVVAGASEDTAVAIAFVLAAALILAVSGQAGNRLAQLLFVAPIVVAEELVLIGHAVHRDSASWLLPTAWLLLAAFVYVAQRRAALALVRRLWNRIRDERLAQEQAALLENTPLGIVVIRDTQIVVCNDALVRMFGYRGKEDLLGRSIRVLMPDDDAWEASREQMAEARSGRAAQRIVKRRRADGSTIDVMLKIAVLRVVDQETEFIAIYEDVAERLEIEENYRDLRRMQQLVFEVAGEGIAIVSDGVIEQANKALSDLVGLSANQLHGLPLKRLFEDPDGWAVIEGRFHRLGNTLKLERRVLHSDGHAVWANVTGCLVDPATAGHESRAIWVLADLTVQKQKEAENWHHANHDVMTGLPNRRFLQDRLDQALAFARRDGRRVAVVMVDLDGFKSVNDRHGHRFGDAVLEEVARRLSTVVRSLDTVGRWGGDEFVLVLKEIDTFAIVEEMVRRVIARLTEPITFLDRQLAIGASVGIALHPDHGDEAEALLLAADLAMYESKGAGGNTWRFAQATDQAPRGKYRPGHPSSMPGHPSAIVQPAPADRDAQAAASPPS